MLILYKWRAVLTTMAAVLFAAGLAFLPSIAMAQEPGADQWVQNIASSQDIQMTSLALGPSGELYIAGTFRGTVDFDPGPINACFQADPK